MPKASSAYYCHPFGGRRADAPWHRRTAPVALCFCLLVGGAVPAQATNQRLHIWLTAEETAIPYKGSRSIPGTVLNGSGHRISDVALTADHPAGWSVRVVPETIGSLDHGEKKSFAVEVSPRSIFGGSHYIKITVWIAGREDGFKYVRVTLNTWKIWAGVGGILAAAVIASFILVYRRVSK